MYALLERPIADFPADTHAKAADFSDAIRDHRCAFLRGFVTPRIWAVFARFFGRSPRIEDVVSARHAGRAWCDATERNLINDVTTYSFTGF